MAEKPGYPQQVPPGAYPQPPPGFVPPAGYAQQVPPYPMDPPPAYTYAQPGGEGYQRPSCPPFQYGGYQSPPTVVLGAPTTAGGPPRVVTVVKVGQWGPFPMQVVCPQCSATIMTETQASPGLLTWLLSGALVFVGCWLGCCLIPCCIPECQDMEHRCPNCKAHLGTYRRI